MTGPESPEPHRAVVGMGLDEARRHLEAHGLRAVVSRRDGCPRSDADWATREGVLLVVKGETVVGVEGRT
jgi:hypothetical protein